MTKEIVLTLVMLTSKHASAAALHCLPLEKSGSMNFLASEATVDLESKIKNISMRLENGRSVSGVLSNASHLGPNALLLSEDVAQSEGISVTVILRGERVYLLVSPYLAMSLPQQLICN